MKPTIKVKKLDERAVLPTYGSDFAAGADLYAVSDCDITIAPAETVLVHTGLSMEIPEGYAGLIYARSGLASKKGLAPANKVGVVDSDYRGEIQVGLINRGNEPFKVQRNDRIAQMMFLPICHAAFTVCAELDETQRGAGGFGSTGVK